MALDKEQEQMAEELKDVLGGEKVTLLVYGKYEKLKQQYDDLSGAVKQLLKQLPFIEDLAEYEYKRSQNGMGHQEFKSDDRESMHNYTSIRNKVKSLCE